MTLILARAFAANLSMPISVHDRTGKIVFYNAAAEAVFGVNFSETGELSAAEWTARFLPEDADGTPVPLEELPVGVALTERRPAHRTCTSQVQTRSRYAAGGDRVPVDRTRGRVVRGDEDLLERGGGVVSVSVVRMRAEEAEAQAARQEGATRLRAAERSRPDTRARVRLNLAMPIYVADADETLVYFNESAEEDRSVARSPRRGRCLCATGLRMLGASRRRRSEGLEPRGDAGRHRVLGAPTGARSRSGSRPSTASSGRSPRRRSRCSGRTPSSTGSWSSSGNRARDWPCERRFGRFDSGYARRMSGPTQRERMVAGELYEAWDSELIDGRGRARQLRRASTRHRRRTKSNVLG